MKDLTSEEIDARVKDLLYAVEENREEPTPAYILNMYRDLIPLEDRLPALGLFCLYEFYRSERLSGSDQSNTRAAGYCLRAAAAGSLDAMYQVLKQAGVSEEEGLV